MKQTQSNKPLLTGLALAAASFASSPARAQYPRSIDRNQGITYSNQADPYYVNTSINSGSDWSQSFQGPAINRESYSTAAKFNQNYSNNLRLNEIQSDTKQSQNSSDITSNELLKSLHTIVKAADQFLAGCNHWLVLGLGGSLVIGFQSLAGRTAQEMHKKFSPYGRAVRISKDDL